MLPADKAPHHQAADHEDDDQTAPSSEIGETGDGDDLTEDERAAIERATPPHDKDGAATSE